MATAAIENRLTSLWETPKTLYGWFATVDHKELGTRYLVTAFSFLIIGGATYSPSRGMDIYALSLIFLTISTAGGAINMIVTIMRMRAPGMAVSRMAMPEAILCASP